MSNKRNIVVMPARAGSKRFLNKNIQLLGGIPLIVHSIQYAKKNCKNARIVVSTDSEQIKEIALENGVEVINRPLIEGSFIPYNYKIGQRSQDLEPLYYENGLLYITKASLILEGKIVGENNFPFIVDHPFAKVDIDSKEDLEYAEYLLNKSED